MKFAALALLCCGACWAQGAEDCKPSALNIPGAPYPCVYSDRRVSFRVSAPDAQKVQVGLGGRHDMTKGTDGLWTFTIPPQVIGFHYYSIDRKSTRLNSSHLVISYAVFCLKKKKIYVLMFLCSYTTQHLLTNPYRLHRL